jgi:hypothetical protein
MHRGKEGLKMAKTSTIALFAGLALTFFVANAYAAEQMATGWSRPYGVSEFVGAFVQNPQGVELGRITDFVIDSQGRVTFAILSHGGFLRMGEKTVAIPFSALTYDGMGRHFVLNISREKLESAPNFAIKDLSSEKWADDVYTYFGQMPYWTEGGLVKGGMQAQEEPGKTEGFPYDYSGF